MADMRDGVIWVDLDQDHHRQVVVDRQPGQYLGHPTTVLLEDGRTILAVYPKGHGKGEVVLKRSADGGRTWSDRLPVPASWATSKETPTIHRVVNAEGNRRLIVFSGLYPIRMAASHDDGATWSELAAIGDFGGIVAMASLIPLRTGPGHYAAYFHDDGRFLSGSGIQGTFTVFQVRSEDGGLTWSRPTKVVEHPELRWCEPGAVRSPDGSQIALLLRENSRVGGSYITFSSDEGITWTKPVELPPTLNGDRHTAKYAPDGRLVVSFRDMYRKSPTYGDWVAWIGTYDDLLHRRPGQYRVRLKQNFVSQDCAYPGVEVLPDGTFVTTTYGHWLEGEQPYILSVRFRVEEIDELAEA